MVLYAALHFHGYYDAMPPVMASHFDARGVPNGWQTKDAFFTLIAVVTAIAGALVLLVPAIVTRLPLQFVNLPHKDYWLAPERAAASQEFMMKWFGWFGCATYGAVCYAFDYAVKANLAGPQPANPGGLFGVLVAFGAFAVFASVIFIRRFAHVPSQDPRKPL